MFTFFLKSSILTPVIRHQIMKIRWTESEIKQVEQRLVELAVAKTHSRSDWTTLLFLAQRVLSPERRRAKTSLTPNIWVSEPYGLLRNNTTYSIVVNVVSSLKLRDWPNSGRPHYNLPLYSWVVANVRHQASQEKTTEVQGSLPLETAVVLEPSKPKPSQSNLELMPKPDLDRRLKDLEISFQAQALENKTLHLGLAHVADRLKELDAQVNDILAFVTSHGYNPKK